jgi:hypothetical protein
LTIYQKLIVQTEDIDPIAKQPLDVGVEALIATIEGHEELIKAIIEARRKRT